MQEAVDDPSREGLNPAYKVGALAWLLLSHKHDSLRLDETTCELATCTKLYRSFLDGLATKPNALGYEDLLKTRYLKKKHWVYAIYMAVLGTLPVLYKICTRREMTHAILGKTSIGTGTKLLDNLNDEIQTIPQAVGSLGRLAGALTHATYDINPDSSVVARAENAGLEVAHWAYQMVRKSNARNLIQTYVADAHGLIQGQMNSITHKAISKMEPTVIDYLRSISEKSIGDVWIDVDLCYLEGRLGSLDARLAQAIELLKRGNDLVFKSSLVYDDVQDIYKDLKTNSINSAVLFALERQIIQRTELQDSSKIPDVVHKLVRSSTLSETVKLADLLFLEGIRCIEEAAARETDLVDWDGLIQGYRFVRLFNLRKLLIKNRDWATAKLFASSLGSFESLRESIPDSIMELEKFL